MIHFNDWIFYEKHEHARIEFNMIFTDSVYEWDGRFGNARTDYYGVCDDPLNPTWGVFGKKVRDYPHSQLFFRDIFQVKLVYGDVDFSIVEETLNKRFEFILTNEYGLKLPKSVDLFDGNKVYPLPTRYEFDMPSRVDDDAK